MNSNEEKIKREKFTSVKEKTNAHKLDLTNLFIGTLIATILSFLLTFIGIWQLIIIPGIVAGFFNDKMRRGIFSGAIGVSIVWIIDIYVAIICKNAYVNVDQFAGLIFGSLGFGWVIVTFILLFGVLFGALGGAIGSGIKMLVKINLQNGS